MTPIIKNNSIKVTCKDGSIVLARVEEEEREDRICAFVAEAKAIGAMVALARAERDFRPNQYDRLAADALELCLRLQTARPQPQAPNHGIEHFLGWYEDGMV